MKNPKTPIIESVTDEFIQAEDVCAMWPITPAPTRDQLLRWSKVGDFVPYFRAVNQKGAPLFERDAVLEYLEREFAPVYAKRRAKQKGRGDV